VPFEENKADEPVRAFDSNAGSNPADLERIASLEAQVEQQQMLIDDLSSRLSKYEDASSPDANPESVAAAQEIIAHEFANEGMVEVVPLEKPVLGYWDIRGRAQSIRHLLTFLGVEFEDKMYATTEDPASRASWLDEKNSSGLDFPNLPYFKDTDGFSMTEHTAIMQYICDKWNPALLGTTAEERGKVEMLRGVLSDVLMKCVMPMFQSDDRAAVSEKFLEAFKGVVPHLGNGFILGDNMCFLDFMWFEMVTIADWVTEGKSMTTYPELVAFSDKMKALPATAACQGEAEKLPFIMRFAKINNWPLEK